MAKTPPLKPWPLPEFEPIHIHDWDDHGSPNLPSNVKTHDPFELFSLFFTDEIMDKLVEWINKHAELYLLDEDAEQARAWQPTCKQELYAYFAVQIYMGITIESCIEDYWKNLNIHSTEHIVKKYIGVVRFQ
jgi:Transposase IS4